MSANPWREPGPFPDTRWTQIERLRDNSPTVRQKALDELVRVYYPALKAYLMATWSMHDEVDEVLQGFVVERLLSREAAAQADREKGRFRSFLKQSLRNYVIDRWRRDARRRKETALEDHERGLASDEPSGDAFDIAWAREVLGEATRRMHEECVARKQEIVWGIFEDRLLRPLLAGVSPPGYDVLCERYRIESPVSAQNALVTAKRKFQRCLYSVIEEYVESEEAADREIADLIAILGGG